MFIVFRVQPSVIAASGGKNFPSFRKKSEIGGPWLVNFDPAWFYPMNGLVEKAGQVVVTFAQLDDWAKRPELAVRHFSGTAIYKKSFAAQPPGANSRVFLDLGSVKESARIKVNGKDCGVLWCAPWRVEVTGALTAGENRFEIEVVNLWPNRLIGDAALKPEEQRTVTNIRTFKPTSPLKSSGLLGPVQLIEVLESSVSR